MSTGADNKSMPGTVEFRDNYDQIFKKRSELKMADSDIDLDQPRVERKFYVFRCSHCDGVIHNGESSLGKCPRCNGDTYGLVDAAMAPPLRDSEARFAPIMSGRFYEGTFYDTVNEKGEKVRVDLGTRQRHQNFMRQRNLTTMDDYKQEWTQAEKDRQARSDPLQGGTLKERKERREQIERAHHEVTEGSGRKKR